MGVGAILLVTCSLCSLLIADSASLDLIMKMNSPTAAHEHGRGNPVGRGLGLVTFTVTSSVTSAVARLLVAPSAVALLLVSSSAVARLLVAPSAVALLLVSSSAVALLLVGPSAVALLLVSSSAVVRLLVARAVITMLLVASAITLLLVASWPVTLLLVASTVALLTTDMAALLVTASAVLRPAITLLVPATLSVPGSVARMGFAGDFVGHGVHHLVLAGLLLLRLVGIIV